MDRRNFLGFSATSLALAGCGGGSGSSGSVALPPVVTPPVSLPFDAELNALSSRMSGTLLRASSAGYAQAALGYNARFDAIKPLAVARCASPEDVAAALSFASTHKVAVTPRCGGHSYAGTSSTAGVVIDVSPMNRITIGNGSATIGAGARLVDIYDQLTAQGVAIPMGSCVSVGIAGLTMGGGIGVVDRAYGLTCDNLLSADVVTADGRRLTCSASSEPELFWALRGGGGGNFGVVTSFTFKTHPTTDITTSEAYFAFADFEKLLSAWQDWQKTAPKELWGQIIVAWSNQGGTPSLYLRTFFLGSEAEAKRHWAGFLTGAGLTPTTTTVKTNSYRNTMLADCTGMSILECHLQDQFITGKMRRSAFAASSDFFNTKVPPAGLQAFRKYILDSMAGNNFGMVIMDWMGGEIQRFGPADTAFVHRNAIFSAEYYSYFPVGMPDAMVDAAQAWLHSFRTVMQPWSSGGAYVNYLDPRITDWKTAYYGSNYQRLAAVKAKYDPAGLFAMQHGVTRS